MQIDEIEEIHYDLLSIVELIDILEDNLDHPIDKRKKKEYTLYKQECNELINIINKRSGMKMYSIIK